MSKNTIESYSEPQTPQEGPHDLPVELVEVFGYTGGMIEENTTIEQPSSYTLPPDPELAPGNQTPVTTEIPAEAPSSFTLTSDHVLNPNAETPVIAELSANADLHNRPLKPKDKSPQQRILDKMKEAPRKVVQVSLLLAALVGGARVGAGIGHAQGPEDNGGPITSRPGAVTQTIGNEIAQGSENAPNSRAVPVFADIDGDGVEEEVGVQVEDIYTPYDDSPSQIPDTGENRSPLVRSQTYESEDPKQDVVDVLYLYTDELLAQFDDPAKRQELIDAIKYTLDQRYDGQELENQVAQLQFIENPDITSLEFLEAIISYLSYKNTVAFVNADRLDDGRSPAIRTHLQPTTFNSTGNINTDIALLESAERNDHFPGIEDEILRYKPDVIGLLVEEETLGNGIATQRIDHSNISFYTISMKPDGLYIQVFLHEIGHTVLGSSHTPLDPYPVVAEDAYGTKVVTTEHPEGIVDAIGSLTGGPVYGEYSNAENIDIVPGKTFGKAGQEDIARTAAESVALASKTQPPAMDRNVYTTSPSPDQIHSGENVDEISVNIHERYGSIFRYRLNGGEWMSPTTYDGKVAFISATDFNVDDVLEIEIDGVKYFPYMKKHYTFAPIVSYAPQYNINE